MDKILDWLTLHLTPELGSAGCLRLIRHFGEPRLALQANPKELTRIPGIRKKAIQALCDGLARKEAQRQLQTAGKEAATIVAFDDPAYPPGLKETHNPPALLFVKGNAACLNQPGLAIVGSRAASEYGRKAAGSLAMRLVDKGMAIISGLALGIDAAAHTGALRAGGITLGVLGCGLDVVYPATNRKLFEEIPQKGALVSEYPFGTRPDSFRFPARNRIISGLALGVLVVEAARRSGSLITAQIALESGKEVFAIPGRIDSGKSEGSHRLLQEGAKLVHTVDDILEELPVPFNGCGNTTEKLPGNCPCSRPTLQSPEEQNVLEFIDVYPKTIDEIMTGTNHSAQKINEILLMLELKGLIEALPGKQYLKTTRAD